jgi:hypothetical protein
MSVAVCVEPLHCLMHRGSLSSNCAHRHLLQIQAKWHTVHAVKSAQPQAAKRGYKHAFSWQIQLNVGDPIQCTCHVRYSRHCQTCQQRIIQLVTGSAAAVSSIPIKSATKPQCFQRSIRLCSNLHNWESPVMPQLQAFKASCKMQHTVLGEHHNITLGPPAAAKFAALMGNWQSTNLQPSRRMPCITSAIVE